MPVVSLLEAFIKFALRELIFCIRFVVHKHNDYEYQCISCDLTGTTGDGHGVFKKNVFSNCYQSHSLGNKSVILSMRLGDGRCSFLNSVYCNI